LELSSLVFLKNHLSLMLGMTLENDWGIEILR